MAVALIVAAGRGERFGSQGPKALVPLLGRPLLQWSVDALRATPGVEEIVVALPPGVAAPTGTLGVTGGRVRSESVRRALAAAPPGDPVLVHDAARPLVTVALIAAVLDALASDAGVDCAIAAVPVTDTIKRAGADAIVLETPDRAGLWAVQTPQGFRRATLQRALDVPDEVLAAATDDAWLVERLGGRVRLVAAPADNLKITRPLDLRLAELLAVQRRDAPAPPLGVAPGRPA